MRVSGGFTKYCLELTSYKASCGKINTKLNKMTQEEKDEIRLKGLLDIFSKEEHRELIEILDRDQKRYHKEQLALCSVVVPKGTCCLNAERISHVTTGGESCSTCSECGKKII